jgi:glycerol-3-phosphate dehydrogenase (NAD(P)+)
MISVAGAGAFGTALAVALSQAGKDVTLWGRDLSAQRSNGESPRLPGIPLPPALRLTEDLADLSGPLLLAVPMQTLGPLLARPDLPRGAPLVACCKGIDLATGDGPTALIRRHRPDSPAAILTGPSFAADIARGLPTALTLACADPEGCARLQHLLSGPTLRLYTSDDPAGAEIGGALKNVIAIAAGLVLGAGLGESARAALVTRGFVEMKRLAAALGAHPETLNGLSGLGDLLLTCTSAQSRNFAHGLALGRGELPDPARTVEGVATARATAALGDRLSLDLPITSTVAAILDARLTVAEAATRLLSRDLKPE